jgi:hypothetical protein
MAPPPTSHISGADIVGTVGVFTDTGGSIATLLDETGSSVTGLAGDVAKGAPFVAAPISGVALLHGIQTGNSQQTFNGTYGLTALAVGVAIPPMGIGMALAKVIDDISEPDEPPSSIFDLAASLPPASSCGGGALSPDFEVSLDLD